MPNAGEKKVLAIGATTVPPSASASNLLRASTSLATESVSEMPLNTGWPPAMPSEAMRVVSPTRSSACMTLSPGTAADAEHSPAGGSGLSRKRISNCVCAPSAWA